MHFGIFSNVQIISRNFNHGLISEVFNLVLQFVKILVICEPHMYKIPIIYINSVSLSVCPRRYILNLCEQGVIFVFNVPSWTCLFVWTKIGQCLEDSSNHCPFSMEHLVTIFIFFWRGEGVGVGF